MRSFQVCWLATEGSHLKARPTVAPNRMAAAFRMVPITGANQPYLACRRNGVDQEFVHWRPATPGSVAGLMSGLGAESKNHHCIWRMGRAFIPCCGSGRSVAWLARLFRVQEVVSSNLTAPTIFFIKDN
jgi:hypothetical protein